MTTPIVPSITDEEVDCLESQCRRKWSDSGKTDRYINLSTSTVSALITRLRAAEKDAARYRYIRETDELPMNLMRLEMMGELLDKAIDTAMEQQP